MATNFDLSVDNIQDNLKRSVVIDGKIRIGEPMSASTALTSATHNSYNSTVIPHNYFHYQPTIQAYHSNPVYQTAIAPHPHYIHPNHQFATRVLNQGPIQRTVSSPHQEGVRYISVVPRGEMRPHGVHSQSATRWGKLENDSESRVLEEEEEHYRNQKVAKEVHPFDGQIYDDHDDEEQQTKKPENRREEINGERKLRNTQKEQPQGETLKKAPVQTNEIKKNPEQPHRPSENNETQKPFGPGQVKKISRTYESQKHYGGSNKK